MKKGFFSKTLVALLVLSLVAGLALTGCGGDKEKADKGKGNKDFEFFENVDELEHVPNTIINIRLTLS